MYWEQDRESDHLHQYFLTLAIHYTSKKSPEEERGEDKEMDENREISPTPIWLA